MKSRTSFRVLAVDDRQDALDIIQHTLGAAGYQVTTVTSAADAVRVLEFVSIDIVISETTLYDVIGLDFIRYVRENFKDLAIVILTDAPCIDSAVLSIKEGAEDYLVKPPDRERLLSIMDRIKDKLILRRQIQEENTRKSYGIIGNSPGIAKVIENIDKASAYNANVLIQGESGVGKELVARAIHYAGERARFAFVPVNCTAIPETLLESELFGYARGAFTGAGDGREGFFQIADGGTLFLDEIGDASLAMQGKLLRVLQNKEIQIVGSGRIKKIDTRIIAATNKDLLATCASRLFREDLYYRLAVIEITVPPLRERREDILPLANMFIAGFVKELKKDPPEFTDNALETIKNYQWPGNVRELENCIQRLMIITDRAVIDVSDLPHVMRSNTEYRIDPMKTLAQAEAEHIRAVLQATGGNKSRASSILGIDRKTLREKIKKFGLPDSPPGNFSPPGKNSPEHFSS